MTVSSYGVLAETSEGLVLRLDGAGKQVILKNYKRVRVRVAGTRVVVETYPDYILCSSQLPELGGVVQWVFPRGELTTSELPEASGASLEALVREIRCAFH